MNKAARRIGFTAVLILCLFGGYYVFSVDLRPGGNTNSEFTSNWSGNQHYVPAKVHQPETVEEVVAVVRDALRRQQKLYPIGSQHSWSFLVDPNENFEFINVDKLNRVMSLELESKTIDVGAGLTIRDLNHYLLHHTNPPLVVRGTGSTQGQTVAGALSNSLNPYGGSWVTFSHYVAEVELVDGTGTLRVLTDADGDLMRAARVSLGLLGVITRIKLRLGEGYIATRAYEKLPSQQAFMEQVARIYTEEVDTHTEFAFFPANDEYGRTFVRRATPAERASIDTEEHKTFTPNRTGTLLTNYVVQPLLRMHPLIETIWMKFNPWSYKTIILAERTTYLHHIFVNETDDYTLYEYYFAFSDLDRLLGRISELRDRLGASYFPNIFKLRAFKTIHNTLLSPQNGRPTFSMLFWSLNTGRPDEPFERFERALIDEFSARHHWGTKTFNYDRKTYEAIYGDSFRKFVEIRREFDPTNLFLREPEKAAFR